MTLSVSGAVLSPEELASLHVSLPLLKDTTASKHVGMWGKITGTQRDYYIAWTTAKSLMGERRWHFCHDARTWQLLPKVSKAESDALAKVASQKFTGDTAFEYEGAAIEGQKAPANEEKRLSYVVQQIQNDACVTPRGAYIQLSEGTIIENRSFEGVAPGDIKQLTSWLHMRNPQDRDCHNIISRANIDTARDIFENLLVDEPTGKLNKAHITCSNCGRRGVVYTT